jgi:hypothetical protein
MCLNLSGAADPSSHRFLSQCIYERINNIKIKLFLLMCWTTAKQTNNSQELEIKVQGKIKDTNDEKVKK